MATLSLSVQVQRDIGGRERERERERGREREKHGVTLKNTFLKEGATLSRSGRDSQISAQKGETPVWQNTPIKVKSLKIHW